KCGAVIPCSQPIDCLLANDERSKRNTQSERLGNAEHIGFDRGMFKRKGLAGATQTTLNLVENEERSRLVTGFASHLQEVGLNGPHTRFALNGLDDHGCRSFIDCL